MPRRSNDFQRLIARIEALSASETARVVESHERREGGKGALRELDIVIEDTVSGHPVRVAIECRDWKKKQSIEWIDALIGKVRDLGIHKMIAVSSSGFTASALQKAEAANIQTLTPRGALDSDWEDLFYREPILRFFGHESNLQGARLSFGHSPPVPDGVDILDWIVENTADGTHRTVGAWALSLFETSQNFLCTQYINANNLMVLEPPTEAPFAFVAGFEGSRHVLIGEDGVRRDVARIELRIVGTTKFYDTARRHVAYDRSVATIASFTTEAGDFHEVTFVQSPGRISKGQYRWVPPKPVKKGVPAKNGRKRAH